MSLEWNYCDSFLHTMSKKTTAKIYEKTALELIAKPLNETSFKRQCRNFQQDSAFSHKSKGCQEWFANNILAFIRAEGVSSGRSDLNPLSYELLDILEQNAYRKCNLNL